MSDDERMSVSTFQSDSGADPSFRSPNISSRGRKRKPVIHDDGTEFNLSPQAKRIKGKAPRGGGRAVIRGGRPAVGDKKRLANIGEGSLFNIVQSGRTFDQMINRWIEEYERNPDAGLVQILQLLLHACGCRGILTSQMINALEYTEIVKVMGEEFDDDSSEYPLIQSGQQWKKFRSNYEGFLKLLISKCRSGIVFDNKLMDGVCSLLAELADNSIRAFRHTATFAAMKISTALVDLVVQLVELREKTMLQIDTEKAKLKQKGTNEQLEVLFATKTEIDEKITDVSDMTSFLFKSVFVHRYRDVVPDIRCICITELGIWMKVHPAYFLEDSYLKYVGWLLYDKQAEVRVKCLQTLLPLFEDSEHVTRVELFLTKFKDRLVSMVMDRDVDVAIKTCTILTNVFRYFPKMLDLKDCVPIYEAVYAANRSLAVAAGEFLNTKVFQGTEDDSDDRNKVLISDLLLFYVECEVHNHATFLVDALIEISPMIKDWSTMVNMLLSDECDEYDNKLVEILAAAVRQAATGELPSGRIGSKKGKDNKQCAEERTRISEVLIPTLPRLLSRHIGDKDKVANLMSIPQFFELHLYPTGRMMRCLEELMSVMERIVEQHSDDEILKNIAITFVHFKSNLAVQQHIEAAKAQLLDTLAVDLRTSLSQFHNEGRMDEEDEAEILSRLKKMNAFAAVEDLKRADLWDYCFHLVKNTDKISNSQIAEKTIINMFLTVSWDVRRLLEDGEANITDAAKNLRKRRNELLKVIESVITNSAAGVENAFLCLCDLLILFNWKLATDFTYPQIASLVITLNRDFNNKINNFLVDNVFVPEERDITKRLDQQAQIELMSKRRNLLAQFCKLIIHGVLPMTDASLVLRYYVQFYNDYGDILKALLVKCREMDRIACSKAISMALISAFEELKASNPNGIDPVDEEFIQLRDLAKRFAMSFGPDSQKNRDAIATVHKYGILHALEVNQTGRRKSVKPVNVAFLEILIEFSPRLLKQDKIAVGRYLEKHCSVSAEALAKDVTWQPYLLYRGSLQDKHDDGGSVRNAASGIKGRGRIGKKRDSRTETTPTPSEFSTV